MVYAGVYIYFATILHFIEIYCRAICLYFFLTYFSFDRRALGDYWHYFCSVLSGLYAIAGISGCDIRNYLLH